jgi:hypothetical protein
MEVAPSWMVAAPCAEQPRRGAALARHRIHLGDCVFTVVCRITAVRGGTSLCRSGRGCDYTLNPKPKILNPKP